MKYIAALILFVIFSLAAIASPAFALVGLALLLPRYAGNIAHSMDMIAAAILGWDGRRTVSAECGREIVEQRPCRFCRILCRLLDKFLEPGHCHKEGSE